MIEFICSCGKQLQAEEQHAGLRTRCPQCGREQAIPRRDDAIRSEATANLGSTRSTEVQQEPVRPRRAAQYPSDRALSPQTSGKAIAALVFGVLSIGCNFFAGVPAIILGLLALLDISKSQGRLSGKTLAVGGMLISAFSFVCLCPLLGFGMYHGWGFVQTSADQSRSKNNLKQLALAMHSYHDANMTFPPAQGSGMTNGFGPPGTHKVSWRVLILPYIEQQNLYLQYRFDEPWDGPNNSKLLTQMPKVYELPGDKTASPGYTYYQVFVSTPSSSPQAMFSTDPKVRVRMSEVTDGTSNTLMIVEAATPVPWTKPDDIPFDANGPVPTLGTHYRGGCNAAFADGSVRFLSPTVSSTTLKALITRNGGEAIGVDF